MLVNNIEETKARAARYGIDIKEDELLEVGIAQLVLYCDGNHWCARFDDRPVMDLRTNTEKNPLGFGGTPDEAIESLIRRK